MYYDVEETKSLIEFNYMMRNKHPNIFINRDPEDDETMKALGVSYVIEQHIYSFDFISCF